MPKYEYACKVCADQFEVTQGFTDDPLIVCAKCGGELRKVFGSIGITFKGSGFYRNDSKASTTSTRTSSLGESTTASPNNGAAAESTTTPASVTPAPAPAPTPATPAPSPASKADGN